MKYVRFCVILVLALLSCESKQEEKYVTSCVFPEGATAEEKARLAAHVVPSERQLEWQKMEKTCFICYGINTFTDKEWGTGKEGKGDLVREVADACKEYGLKFAVYLSPWDMNHPAYGTEAYNDFFVNQLTELLTQYGRVDEVWFDGACGEGPNGKKQDSLVKSPQKLIDIYYSSVGKNSLLLLNLPPDKRGLVHENDVRSLQGMVRILDDTFRDNLLKSAQISSMSVSVFTDGALETYWQGGKGNNQIEITFGKKQLFDRLLLQENITEGQRIEDFALECWIDNQWKVVAEGTTVGYKRILRFNPVETEKARIVIRGTRDLPQLAEIGIYKASEEEIA